VNRPAAAPGRPVDSPADAWSLARALSPHPRVRIADVDDAGAIANSYPATLPAAGPAPADGRPWAIHLADDRGRYRLLGFDLDAKRGPATTDVQRLRELLTRAGLPHVVCVSGPGGGRHVWAALAEPVTAAVVAGIARGLSDLLPSLDPIPLLNPRTGALRPPLAPHRHGGRSEVIAGQLADLTRPVATAAHVLTLAGLAQADQLGPDPEQPARGRLGLAVDEHGHRHLRGARRPLTARSRAALYEQPSPAADTSVVLRTALCGAVHARWRFADVQALLATAPGLEHVRSRATGRGADRQPYPEHEARKRLAAEWDRAVGFVAAHPVGPAADPAFQDRQDTVAAAVAAVQRRADASPGRWAQGGGPADRRVLDIACRLMLDAVRADIELDTRRAGDLTGISRETARIALQRLTRDGWLLPAAAAAGVHGAHWTLPTTPPCNDRDRPAPELSTPVVGEGLSQENTRPGCPPANYSAWRSHLTHRTATLRHDALTHAGLGHHTARVYQALTTTPTDLVDLMARTGYSRPRLSRLLDRLATHQLARTDRRGRWRLRGRTHTGGTRLGRAARTLGVLGVLVDRGRRYAVERAAWAWWTDELAWRRAPAAAKRRSPGAGQLELVPTAGGRRHHGRHPVDDRGRADYAAALAHLTQARGRRQAS